MEKLRTISHKVDKPSSPFHDKTRPQPQLRNGQKERILPMAMLKLPRPALDLTHPYKHQERVPRSPSLRIRLHLRDLSRVTLTQRPTSPSDEDLRPLRSQIEQSLRRISATLIRWGM